MAANCLTPVKQLETDAHVLRFSGSTVGADHGDKKANIGKSGSICFQIITAATTAFPSTCSYNFHGVQSYIEGFAQRTRDLGSSMGAGMTAPVSARSCKPSAIAAPAARPASKIAAPGNRTRPVTCGKNPQSSSTHHYRSYTQTLSYWMEMNSKASNGGASRIAAPGNRILPVTCGNNPSLQGHFNTGHRLRRSGSLHHNGWQCLGETAGPRKSPLPGKAPSQSPAAKIPVFKCTSIPTTDSGFRLLDRDE